MPPVCGGPAVASKRKIVTERQRFYLQMLMPALAVLLAVTLRLPRFSCHKLYAA